MNFRVFPIPLSLYAESWRLNRLHSCCVSSSDLLPKHPYRAHLDLLPHASVFRNHDFCDCKPKLWESLYTRPLLQVSFVSNIHLYRVNAKSELFMLLSKAVYCFVFTFFSQPGYPLFKSIVLVIFSSLSFLSYLWNRPYYSQTTQTVVEMFSGMYAWTNWVLLFT